MRTVWLAAGVCVATLAGCESHRSTQAAPPRHSDNDDWQPRQPDARPSQQSDQKWRERHELSEEELRERQQAKRRPNQDQPLSWLTVAPTLQPDLIYSCYYLAQDPTTGDWAPEHVAQPNTNAADPYPGKNVVVVYAQDALQLPATYFQMYRSFTWERPPNPMPSPSASCDTVAASGTGTPNPTTQETVLWWRILFGRWPLQVCGNEIAGSPGTCAILMKSTRANSSTGVLETVERVIAVPDPAPPGIISKPAPDYTEPSTVYVWTLGDRSGSVAPKSTPPIGSTSTPAMPACVEIVDGVRQLSTPRVLSANEPLTAFVGCIMNVAAAKHLTEAFPPGRHQLPLH